MTDVVLPTKCDEWSLNVDFETKKEFWWNSKHSISIWQVNVNVPEPPEAVDDVVWKHFLTYQKTAVYKLCVACDGPEQNEDLLMCCLCGGSIHKKCSVNPTESELTTREANREFRDCMTKCPKCADVKVEKPTTEPVHEEPNARRAARRALQSMTEYKPETQAELQRLVAMCEENPHDADLMKKVQLLVASHFQPGKSVSYLQKEPIKTKADGLGVVAARDIPRFTIIGVYPGYEDPLSGEQAKMGRPGPRYSLVDLNCADYFNNVFIEFGECFTPFINEPNEKEFSNVAWIQETCRPEGRLSVMTTRDIEAGEEVMIGYGPLYPRTYPYNYDAYAYHLVDGFDDPPCFALWHWTTMEEKDADFVFYCGYDNDTDTYTYWETEDEAAENEGEKSASKEKEEEGEE